MNKRNIIIVLILAASVVVFEVLFLHKPNDGDHDISDIPSISPIQEQTGLISGQKQGVRVSPLDQINQATQGVESLICSCGKSQAFKQEMNKWDCTHQNAPFIGQDVEGV